MIAILLVRINFTLLFVLTTATGIDIHLADCTLRMTMHFDKPQRLTAERTAWLRVIHHQSPLPLAQIALRVQLLA
jgi:hypothetical protein